MPGFFPKGIRKNDFAIHAIGNGIPKAQYKQGAAIAVLLERAALFLSIATN